MNNLNVNIGKGKWYSTEYLVNFARTTEGLLKTEAGNIIVSNMSGWITLVTPQDIIIQRWAGEVTI